MVIILKSSTMLIAIALITLLSTSNCNGTWFRSPYMSYSLFIYTVSTIFVLFLPNDGTFSGSRRCSFCYWGTSYWHQQSPISGFITNKFQIIEIQSFLRRFNHQRGVDFNGCPLHAVRFRYYNEILNGQEWILFRIEDECIFCVGISFQAYPSRIH